MASDQQKEEKKSYTHIYQLFAMKENVDHTKHQHQIRLGDNKSLLAPLISAPETF